MSSYPSLHLPPLTSTSFLLSSHLSALALGASLVLVPLVIAQLRHRGGAAGNGRAEKDEGWWERDGGAVEKEKDRGATRNGGKRLAALLVLTLFLQASKASLKAFLSKRTVHPLGLFRLSDGADIKTTVFLVLLLSHLLDAMALWSVVGLVWLTLPYRKRTKAFLVVLAALAGLGVAAEGFEDVQLAFHLDPLSSMGSRIVGFAGALTIWVVLLALTIVLLALLARSPSSPTTAGFSTLTSRRSLHSSHLALAVLVLPLFIGLTSHSIFWLLLYSGPAENEGKRGWLWWTVLPAGDVAAVLVPLFALFLPPLLPPPFPPCTSHTSLPSSLTPNFHPSHSVSASSSRAALVPGSSPGEHDDYGVLNRPPLLPRLSQLGSAAGSYVGSLPLTFPALSSEDTREELLSEESVVSGGGGGGGGEGSEEALVLAPPPSISRLGSEREPSSRWSGDTSERTSGRKLSKRDGGGGGGGGRWRRLFGNGGAEAAKGQEAEREQRIEQAERVPQQYQQQQESAYGGVDLAPRQQPTQQGAPFDTPPPPPDGFGIGIAFSSPDRTRPPQQNVRFAPPPQNQLFVPTRVGPVPPGPLNGYGSFEPRSQRLQFDGGVGGEGDGELGRGQSLMGRGGEEGDGGGYGHHPLPTIHQYSDVPLQPPPPSRFREGVPAATSNLQRSFSLASSASAYSTSTTVRNSVVNLSGDGHLRSRSGSISGSSTRTVRPPLAKGTIVFPGQFLDVLPSPSRVLSSSSPGAEGSSDSPPVSGGGMLPYLMGTRGTSWSASREAVEKARRMASGRGWAVGEG